MTNYRDLARSATTLAAAATTDKAATHPHANTTRRSLSNEVVAQIKKELRTQRVTDVARAYGLKPSVVRAIEDGLNYKEVKAAE